VTSYLHVWYPYVDLNRIKPKFLNTVKPPRFFGEFVLFSFLVGLLSCRAIPLLPLASFQVWYDTSWLSSLHSSPHLRYRRQPAHASRPLSQIFLFTRYTFPSSYSRPSCHTPKFDGTRQQVRFIADTPTSFQSLDPFTQEALENTGRLGEVQVQAGDSNDREKI